MITKQRWIYLNNLLYDFLRLKNMKTLLKQSIKQFWKFNDQLKEKNSIFQMLSKNLLNYYNILNNYKEINLNITDSNKNTPLRYMVMDWKL